MTANGLWVPTKLRLDKERCNSSSTVDFARNSTMLLKGNPNRTMFLILADALKQWSASEIYQARARAHEYTQLEMHKMATKQRTYHLPFAVWLSARNTNKLRTLFQKQHQTWGVSWWTIFFVPFCCYFWTPVFFFLLCVCVCVFTYARGYIFWESTSALHEKKYNCDALILAIGFAKKR